MKNIFKQEFPYINFQIWTNIVAYHLTYIKNIIFSLIIWEVFTFQQAIVPLHLH